MVRAGHQDLGDGGGRRAVRGASHGVPHGVQAAPEVGALLSAPGHTPSPLLRWEKLAFIDFGPLIMILYNN